jgi:hypothetical protein
MPLLTSMTPGSSRGGGAAGGVRASAGVAALIGAEVLGRLRGDAFRRYSCCR